MPWAAPVLAEEAGAAVEILAVTSLVDGALDAGRIEMVLDYAGALAVDEHWLEDLAASRAADLGRSSPTWAGATW